MEYTLRSKRNVIQPQSYIVTDFLTFSIANITNQEVCMCADNKSIPFLREMIIGA